MSAARRATDVVPLVIFTTIALAGCAPRRGFRPAPPPSDPGALLAAVQSRENQIVSLRARFTAVTHVGNEGHRVDGVLLVKKPDRFRMRLMLPLGPTVFDYVSWGTRAQITLPLSHEGGAAPPPGFAPFSQDDLGQAFLRGAHAFPGTCLPSRDADGVAVVCRDDAGVVLRRLDIDPRDGTIRDETSFEAGAPRMILLYSDYRPADGTYLPLHIVMRYPQRELSVMIGISGYEVNPRLADALFEPSRPWGS